ncbi:MAG: hypothetical protein KBI47_02000 [Armatimonadetes bacterium]|nr:hypothetical protein [Armatimonadota bacterium]MDI9587091.1 hypothetical protein [Acidobacteriota bacterium]
MIRYGYALLLAAAFGAVSLAVNYQRANRQPALFLEAFGDSFGKYGLRSFAALSHLKAADLCLANAASLGAKNPDAAGTAKAIAARNFKRAADIVDTLDLPEQAESLRARAAALIPQDRAVQVGILANRARQDDVDARERLYRLAFRENHPDALVAVAHMLFAQGMEPDAESILRHTVRKHPGHVGARLSLSEVLIERGEMAAAAEQASEAIQLTSDPKTRARAWSLLASSGSPVDFHQRMSVQVRDLLARYGVTAAALLLYILAILWPSLCGLARRCATRAPQPLTV